MDKSRHTGPIGGLLVGAALAMAIEIAKSPATPSWIVVLVAVTEGLVGVTLLVYHYR